MNEAQHASEAIHAACAAVDAHLVAASVDVGDRPGMPSVALSAEEFAALVRKVHPPVVYLFQTVLDVAGEIEAALDEAGLGGTDGAARSIGRAAARLRPHEGAIARVLAQVVAGGVLHITYVAADWIETFEEEVASIVAIASEEDAARGLQAGTAARAHARALATRLVAAPAFSSGRVSFAKRRFLAGELFPDESDRVLDEVVQLAENLHWLAGAER